MRTLAIVNQKGGCGKTTTAINLAATLAEGGQRVLLVDMDPQGHCAAGLGVPEDRLEYCMARALLSQPPGGPEPLAWLWNATRGVHLAPSSVALAGLESARGGLAGLPDRDRRLEQMLDRLSGHFDWCVVDCPPTIGYLTFNALRAADEALVPVETGYFAFKAAERQLATIQALVTQIGREMAVRVVPTLHRDDSQLSHDILGALARRTSPESLGPVIRDHAVLREAASFGQSVVEFAAGSGAHQDFQALAHWLQSQSVAPRARGDEAGSPQAADALGPGARGVGLRGAAPLLSIEVDGDSLPAVYGGQQRTGQGRAAELAQRLRLGPAPHAAGDTG
jgi:chromosome partitioning protein